MNIFLNMPRNVSKYRLKKATEHLAYEITGFCEIFLRLNSSNSSNLSQNDINIFLNSFAAHTRNLFDFFYPKKKGLRPDDMIVYDYINNRKSFNNEKTKKRDLIFIVKKTDKQVAHLTYARNRYSLKTNKSWSTIDIGKKMTKTMAAFHNALPDSYKSWTNIELIEQVIKLLNRVLRP